MHEPFNVLKVIFDNISVQHPQETSHFIQNEIQNPGSTKSYMILAIPTFTSTTSGPLHMLLPGMCFLQRNAWLTLSAPCQVFLSHWFPWPSRLIL